MKPYYENNNGVLYHGDCLEIMPQLEPVDLTVTSPPYDNLRTYNGYSFDFEGIAQQLYQVTKPGGVVVWVVGDATVNGSETGTSFKQALYFKDVCGFNLHDTMIYSRKSPPLTHNRYEQEFEYMFVFSKGKPTTFNGITTKRKYSDNRQFKSIRREKDGSFDFGYVKQGDVLRHNIWQYATGGGCSSTDKIAFLHPAIFPEALAQDHIISWSNPTGIILDCFAGSGTTLKMAERLNRRWIGIEISEEYCEIAAKRIDAENRQLKLF